MCRESYQSIENSMGSDKDAVEISIFGNPLQLRDSADIFRVRADNIDRLFLDEVLEVLPQVYLLSGVNRDGSTLGHLPKYFGIGILRVVAGNQVLKPGDVER